MAAAGEDVLMRLAGALLVSAVLAGCGSASSSSLGDAVDATTADTSRFEMTYHFDALGDEKEATFGVKGVFDFPNDSGAMVLTDQFPFFDEGVSLEEFRLLGRTGYARWIVKGRTYWVKQTETEPSGDPFAQLIPLPGTPTKPTGVLTRVLSASDEITELGDEDVRGTETTHYRARVSVARLVEQLPRADQPGGDVAARWGRFVPVDIWIDEESRLRRIMIRQPEDAANNNPAITIAVELYDYGVAANIEPPAEETISQEEFDRLTSVVTLRPEQGEGDEIAPEEVCQGAREELPEKQADLICREMKEQG
jgi:hypothetical protein